jgi:hypothetical protein
MDVRFFAADLPTNRLIRHRFADRPLGPVFAAKSPYPPQIRHMAAAAAIDETEQLRYFSPVRYQTELAQKLFHVRVRACARKCAARVGYFYP